jgi:hypothetical protein
MFNSLKYAKNLEEAGVPRAQAEAHVLLISEFLEMSFVTKQDMALLKQDFLLLRQDLEQKIIQSEQRMTIRLGTIVSIAIGVAVTLAKLFT